MWAVTLKTDGRFIGDCGLTLQNIDGEELPEIGYHIHRSFWRQGFAREAATAVRDWAFRHTSYDQLFAYMKHTNIASAAVAQAIGMTKTKEFIDKKNEMTYVYGISRGVWDTIIE